MLDEKQNHNILKVGLARSPAWCGCWCCCCCPAAPHRQRAQLNPTKRFGWVASMIIHVYPMIQQKYVRILRISEGGYWWLRLMLEPFLGIHTQDFPRDSFFRYFHRGEHTSQQFIDWTYESRLLIFTFHQHLGTIHRKLHDLVFHCFPNQDMYLNRWGVVSLDLYIICIYVCCFTSMFNKTHDITTQISLFQRVPAAQSRWMSSHAGDMLRWVGPFGIGSSSLDDSHSSRPTC